MTNLLEARKRLNYRPVTDKMLLLYYLTIEKIRAISTGVAAEYYLMQNRLADNTILGSKYNREEKVC
jgi:hypothetical protein